MSDPFTYLHGLEHFGIKVGLENITTLVTALGHPEQTFPTIHIAGTNGKGSVTAMIDTALRAAGYRSARYTSPHLLSLAERFAIDGRPVSEEALAAAIDRVRGTVDRLRATGTLDVQPTFFEVTTAVAFELFRQASVDVAVVEVGLGGRLDATNVISPLAGAITSIALDHEQYLGTTIAEIAREKAGIIKPGMLLVAGRLPVEALEAVERAARDRGTVLVEAAGGVAIERAGGPGSTRVHLRTPADDYGPIDLALSGAHQVDNALVAVRLLELMRERGLTVPRQAIIEGLTHVSWPGRLQTIRLGDGREAILDAAHNPAGAAALAAFLAEAALERVPIVFGAMKDKDAAGMLRALLPRAALLVITRPPGPRAADPALLADVARALAPDLPVFVEPQPRDALDAAWRGGPRILVAGSIFLLGDVMAALAP